MKWRKISVDQERKSISTENYEDFQNCLSQIDEKNQHTLFQKVQTETPIKSYGVILVDIALDKISYFACQRRTTIEFAEMIKCGPVQSRFFEYLSNMTEYERNLILECDYERIWKDLLLGDAKLLTKTFDYTSSIYEKYFDCFPNLINYTTSVQDQPPWELPKGRFKKGDRTLLASAIRELKEEAQIDLEEVELLSENINDIFRGTDGQLYQTTYFIIKADFQYEPKEDIYDPDNVISTHRISDDMRSFTWIELEKHIMQKRGATVLCDRLETMLYRLHSKLIRNEIVIEQ